MVAAGFSVMGSGELNRISGSRGTRASPKGTTRAEPQGPTRAAMVKPGTDAVHAERLIKSGPPAFPQAACALSCALRPQDLRPYTSPPIVVRPAVGRSGPST